MQRYAPPIQRPWARRPDRRTFKLRENTFLSKLSSQNATNIQY
jgi:hypothetical protein